MRSHSKTYERNALQVFGAARNEDSAHSTETQHRNIAFVQKQAEWMERFPDIPQSASRVLYESKKGNNGGRFYKTKTI